MTWCNISIHNAVATSAALGFPIAVANVLGYVVSGQSVQGLPAGSFGYIWLPALVVIALCSVLTAPLGAKAAHNLPVKKLKRVFASILYLLAAYMRYVQALNFQLQLRVYHEVSVLKADEQSYEYVNCHAGSGLMNGLAPSD